jgi:hypothetical protein
MNKNFFRMGQPYRGIWLWVLLAASGGRVHHHYVTYLSFEIDTHDYTPFWTIPRWTAFYKNSLYMKCIFLLCHNWHHIIAFIIFIPVVKHFMMLCAKLTYCALLTIKHFLYHVQGESVKGYRGVGFISKNKICTITKQKINPISRSFYWFALYCIYNLYRFQCLGQGSSDIEKGDSIPYLHVLCFPAIDAGVNIT